MDRRTDWVLLAYRLPREPSTPRITLWRELRRLGYDPALNPLYRDVLAHYGVVALPLDARTRARFDWLAQEVVDNGGEATVWLAEPGSKAQERALAARMAARVTADYARIIEAASVRTDEPKGVRRRMVARLRSELRRIGMRDYFPGAIGGRARAAVEALGDSIEVAS